MEDYQLALVGKAHNNYKEEEEEEEEKEEEEDMIVNLIQWRGSSFLDLRKGEYFFISITPRSTLTRSGSIC